MKRIKPLLAIMTPRNIPWSREKFNKINYVDKLWVKYTPVEETLKIIEKFFLEHTEYTHLILNSDDGVPDYDAIPKLIADVEKYDFPVVCGTCCIDKLSDDMFLNVTIDSVVDVEQDVGRYDYKVLPNEFRELNAVIKVWFQGNATSVMRRDIIRKIGLTYKSLTKPLWTKYGDLGFSFNCAKQGVPQYCDLRVYMEHFKYPLQTPPYNVLVGKLPSEVIFEKATINEIPKDIPAPILDEIPEKFQKIYDFHYGRPRQIKICLVTEFEQVDYFQWYMALKYVGTHILYEKSSIPKHRLICSDVIMNPETRHIYPDNHPYWNPIREADLIFVYTVRRNIKDSNKPWQWYMLPVWTKKFMHPEAKMICQFDDELMWLWDPEHVWWDDTVPEVIGKTPEQFLDETKVLQVADAYFTVINNPPWSKYCNKPVYYMPLPQLFRYKDNILWLYLMKRPKTNKVAIMTHSLKSSSAKHTIDNVIHSLNIPVILFTNKLLSSAERQMITNTLPLGSQVIENIPKDGYMFLLRGSCIAIDDNEGYNGWSRFVLECALSCIPCIGSTKAVEYIFPELYTKHKDYDTQQTLAEKLLNDEDFYKLIVSKGWIRAKEGLSDLNLVMKLLKIAIVDLNIPVSCIPVEQTKYVSLVELLTKAIRDSKMLPRRPCKGETIYDSISKKILDMEQWDELYGEWKELIENPKEYERCLKIAEERSKL